MAHKSANASDIIISGNVYSRNNGRVKGKQGAWRADPPGSRKTPTIEKMIDAGFREVVEKWTPILDEFDKYDVKFALEVHPGEIAFDYYTFKRLIQEFGGWKTLGCNFEPSAAAFDSALRQ